MNGKVKEEKKKENDILIFLELLQLKKEQN
jgi:hypothetical protein